MLAELRSLLLPHCTWVGVDVRDWSQHWAATQRSALQEEGRTEAGPAGLGGGAFGLMVILQPKGTKHTSPEW